MSSSLKVHEFLNQYQHRPKLNFTSRQIGMNRQIQLSRQTADNFDAADKSELALSQFSRGHRLISDDVTLFIRSILGSDFPQVTLPVAPGRNLAVLVEAAARNHLLHNSGYNAAQDFITRQHQTIAQYTEASN